MKCPLTAKGVQTHSDGILTIMGDCLKEECAWWDTQMGQCSINSLKSNLENIALRLMDIAKELTLVKRK